MQRAAIFLSVAACAKLVGIHDYQPNDASGPIAPSFDATNPPPCNSWGSAGCVTSLVAGVDKTCAVANGVVYCWGNLPGDGTLSEASPTAIRTGGSGVIVTASSTGVQNGVTCLDDDGKVSCWGDDALAQQQSSPGSNMPGDPFPQQWSSIAVGADHACGLTPSGAVSCWGADGADQLGDVLISGSACGPTPCTATPSPIELLPGAVELAAGDSHTCARYVTGTVACWGSNSEGQLGDNGETVEAVPTNVVVDASAPPPITHIVAGLAHTCALNSIGQFACWGAGGNGQRGDGSKNLAESATFIDPISNPVTAIATGESDTCVIDSAEAVFCFGDNTFGVVGTTDFGSDAVQSPAPVGITNATSITVGKRHACALLDTGGIACWGDNSANELGTEAPNTCHLTQCSDTPVDVPPPM